MRWLLTIFALMQVAYFALATNYNAASTSKTDVQNAVNLAVVPGDSVTLPAGTNTYNGQVDITNAITIIGNGTNQTGGRTRLINSTTAGAGLETPIFNIKSRADPGAKIEIYNIDFQDENLDWNSDAIDVPGSVYGGAESGGIFERTVVIHNCRFEGFAFCVKVDGCWGLSYSNHYINSPNAVRVKGFNMLANLPVSNPESYRWSSTNYWVIEDELFQVVQWTTNNYMWANTDPGGTMGTDFNSDGQNGCTINQHFFTNGPPSNFAQLAYPHPLRIVGGGGGGGGAAHNHKIGVQAAIGGRRR